MALYAKDALKLGVASVPDGKGGRTLQKFTQARVEHLAKRLRDMLDAGLNVPVAKEHQPSGKPMGHTEYEDYLRNKVDLLVGHTADGFLHPERGHLEINVEAPTPEDEKALARARFISPEIVHNFRDGSGKLWPGESITHFALTPRPVQHGQEPFRRVERTALSHEGNGTPAGACTPQTVPWSYEGTPLRLSLDDFQPVQLSEEDMAEEFDEGGAATATDEAPPKKDSDVDLPGEPGAFDDCKELLAAHGINLPEDTDEENGWEHLKVALTALQGVLTPKNQSGEEPMPGEGQTPQPVNDNGMLMSLQAENKRLKAENVKYRDTGTKRYVGGLRGRLDALRRSGFLSADDVKEYEPQLAAVRLSLDDQPDPLELEIRRLERTARRHAFVSPSKIDLSMGGDGPTAVTDPEHAAAEAEGSSSREAQEKAGEELAARAGAGKRRF
jgi:hypothetical protein